MERDRYGICHRRAGASPFEQIRTFGLPFSLVERQGKKFLAIKILEESISLFLKFFLDRVIQNSLLRIDLSDLINRLDRERRREFFPIREWN